MDSIAEICPTDEGDMEGAVLQRTIKQIMIHFMALRDWKMPYLTALPEMTGSMGTR